ncbi:MAG TPA: hypothetical protein VKR55_16280 [Bradyrhizobium sp.]|uniref:hypothetical protein n=1 Tax=Bradyrhizobium sp. TaxID=376 RepID=UPI002C9D90FD|nr:hypothetical protein [Bradyrhizobium sp.]HLZ03691.1 hypothetical protein [Bradyrhizobium sp.]
MIGSLMMCVSVVVLLCGMLLGIVMGISEDFVLQPAHAHLNLLGGVMLFLFGLYYRVVPAAGGSRLAKFQGWLHIAGGLLLPAGVAVVVTHGNAFVAIPIVGSLITLAAMALFAVIVFRTARV